MSVLTLYTAKVCPYAHRVELALAETGVPHSQYQIDLQNKPEWYAPKVNPASKVPAVAYGGPDVPADQPSPESTKIAESLVLLEFIADLRPDSHLLPKDPVKRAQARFFIEVVGSKFVPQWAGLFMRGEPPAALLKVLEEVQALLPEKGFVVGSEPSIADFALLPFLARGELAAKHELVTGGTELLKALQEPKLARLWEWYQALKARPSFSKTFDEEYIATAYKKRFADRAKAN